jgi:putative oxidoreductase
MERWLGRYADEIYATLRVVAGVMFALHGAEKFGLLGGAFRMPGNPLMMVAGAIELVGGLLIAIGLFASVAAFIASGQMAVAYFVVHFPQGWNPVANKGEVAVLYCFLFLYIAARGSGACSVDRQMRRRR